MKKNISMVIFCSCFLLLSTLIPIANASYMDSSKDFLTEEEYQQMLNEAFPLSSNEMTVDVLNMGDTISYEDAIQMIDNLKKIQNAGITITHSDQSTSISNQMEQHSYALEPNRVMPVTYIRLHTMSITPSGDNAGIFDVAVPAQVDFSYFISGELDVQNDHVINVQNFNVDQTYGINLESCDYTPSYRLNYPREGSVTVIVDGTAHFLYQDPKTQVSHRLNWPIYTRDSFEASDYT